MNPLILKGLALLAIVALITFGVERIHHCGYVDGQNAQKVADQAQFDQYNQERTDQATLAANMFQAKQQEIIAKQHENDLFKTQLGEQHAINVEKTNKLAAMYSAYSLRFRTTENSTDRQGGGLSGDASGHTASADTANIVELPREVTANLRELAIDADRLNDEYKTCYGYVNKVKN